MNEYNVLIGLNNGMIYRYISTTWSKILNVDASTSQVYYNAETDKLPPIAIVFLAGSSLIELVKNKSTALNAIMSIVLSLGIFGAGMYSYSRLEYGTTDYVLYTASAYLIVSAVTISVSSILVMLNSAKKRMKSE